MRGMTWKKNTGEPLKEISIHMPHAGHDKEKEESQNDIVIFQSTCPMRGMTGIYSDMTVNKIISIHMPHAGHDG